MRLGSIVVGLCLAAGAAAAQSLAPGAFELQRGGEQLFARCAAGETMRVCAEAAAALFGRVRALPEPEAAAPVPPLSVGAAPDVQPLLWSQPAPGLDPTRLPLGNRRMVTDAPRQGYVFACDPYMYSMPTIIGARRTGPWVHEDSMSYDATAKLYDRGRVEWPGRFAAEPSGAWRVISGNGLPLPGVPTGLFPVSPDDPAYQFDRNPNAIVAQPIRFAVPLEPRFGDAPRCVYKEVGITLDGVALHTGLDSSGRDENGYELNDTCGGKPQPGGLYHRSIPSDCTPHLREPGAVVGYALDGFPITGPFAADGTELTTAQLDACHGTSSAITSDGRTQTAYHYVLTRDFPYSVACFRGTPTRNAFPKLPGAPPQFR